MFASRIIRIVYLVIMDPWEVFIQSSIRSDSNNNSRIELNESIVEFSNVFMKL
jgi:hypothetical protein